jgi:hypothetical protein
LEDSPIKIVENEETVVKGLLTPKNQLRNVTQVQSAKKASEGLNQSPEKSLALTIKALSRLLDPKSKQETLAQTGTSSQSTYWQQHLAKNPSIAVPDCTDKGLPCNVDWDSYLPAVENQGDKGICYIYSTRHMLLTRANIMYGDHDYSDLSIGTTPHSPSNLNPRPHHQLRLHNPRARGRILHRGIKLSQVQPINVNRMLETRPNQLQPHMQ